MNAEDPNLKPTTRKIITAALLAVREADEALQNIVGDALPGAYDGFHRIGWACRVRLFESEYRPKDIGVKLTSPNDHDHYTARDLNALCRMLHADDVSIDCDGNIDAYYNGGDTQ